MNQRECDSIFAALSAYLDGELPAARVVGRELRPQLV